METPTGAPPRRTARRGPAGTRLSVLAALAAGLLLATACGGSDDDGGDDGLSGDTTSSAVLGPVEQASGTPVRVGVISDGQSPAGDLTYELDTVEATAEYLNEHRSGIAGRPIELVTCEALADPGKASDCANRMVEEDVVAVVVGSSGAGESIWTPLHEAGVPVLSYSANGPASLQDSESTFVLSDQFFTLVTLPIQAAEDVGAEKVTVVAIDLPVTTSLYDVAEPMFTEAGIDLELVLVPAGTADMTPQMQPLADSDPGVVHVVGSDSFCISAFNGLQAVGYTGPVAAIAYCITDATREAVAGDFLEGITVSATAPVGAADDPGIDLFNAVATTYGDDIDVNQAGAAAMFITFAGFHAAVEDISGDITPETVTAAIKSMPEKDLPAATGMRFRCNGKASPAMPATCVRGGLMTVLDDQGQPTTYQPVGVSPIED